MNTGRRTQGGDFEEEEKNRVRKSEKGKAELKAD